MKIMIRNDDGDALIMKNKLTNLTTTTTTHIDVN